MTRPQGHHSKDIDAMSPHSAGHSTYSTVVFGFFSPPRGMANLWFLLAKSIGDGACLGEGSLLGVTKLHELEVSAEDDLLNTATDQLAQLMAEKDRAANDPSVKAETYLKKHKLMALFELMGESLVREKPDDPRAFLVSYLTQLKEKSDPTSPLNFFDGDDVDTLFSMYDASNMGLTPKQCREALNAIGLESVAVPTGQERFDKAAFMSLVK